MTDENDIFSELDDVQHEEEDVDRDEVLERFGRPGASDLGDAFTMVCAGCQHDHIHQFKAEVFFRSAEDSDDGIHVDAAHSQAEFDHEMDGNPSSRRSGMSVWFWCEACSVATRLDIIQHKGKTHTVKETDGHIDIAEAMSL